MQVHTW